MNPDQHWNRLSSAARKERSAKALQDVPLGFATKVSAQWLARRALAQRRLLWESLALRFAVGSMVVAAAVTFLFKPSLPFENKAPMIFSVPEVELPFASRPSS